MIATQKKTWQAQYFWDNAAHIQPQVPTLT